MTNLDWNELLHLMEHFATSLKAKSLIQKLAPLATPEEASRYRDMILKVMGWLDHGRPQLESVDLFDPWFLRLKKGASLRPVELKDTRTFCMEYLALVTLVDLVTDKPLPEFSVEGVGLDGEGVLSALDQIIMPSGDIRSDASEKLYQLIREKESLRVKIHQVLDQLIKEYDIHDYLQDRYVTTREGRWVIPVKSGRQHAVAGVIHGSSQTKQTVYLEPEVTISLNNRLREIEVEIEEEIERLLLQISNFLRDFIGPLEKAHQLMLKYDVLFALAQFSRRVEGHRVTWSSGSLLRLEGLRHPLMVFHGKNPVANTVELNTQKRILLLSGPNAGGKTVLLKSIGLACQMARCGLPVCALSAEVPFFSEILVGIGDSQAINQELSTFAAHLKLLNQASQLEGSSYLILVDEIA
ncbi:MAG: endonuclease MutS2, partial [Bdellovibrionaceae bacterium]|nr:endonuclease MutS2 [Pseudobdellovibrionaceae bacterium]MDW8190992.1 endonuclease MutS2 [Pseudobdellovibrionaceae bacterium]